MVWLNLEGIGDKKAWPRYVLLIGGVTVIVDESLNSSLISRFFPCIIFGSWLICQFPNKCEKPLSTKRIPIIFKSCRLSRKLVCRETPLWFDWLGLHLSTERRCVENVITKIYFGQKNTAPSVRKFNEEKTRQILRWSNAGSVKFYYED
jgi:hypothetical protein